MIPLGYMAKQVSTRPYWLKNNQIQEICSLSGCISKDIADYINYWRHNGFWLFDSLDVIQELAREENIDLSSTTLFFYESFEYQWDEFENQWQIFSADQAFSTQVALPLNKELLGYDIVSFSTGNQAECSFLSCNHMAEEIEVNAHCLLDSFQQAKQLLEKSTFKDCEPGPSRIIAVYKL